MSNTASPAEFLREVMARMAADGLAVDSPVADGTLRRCGTTDRPQGTDGAYIIHSDNPASAWWRNWRTGTEGSYCGKDTASLTPAERKALAARVAAQKAASTAEQESRYATAAKRAASIWEQATSASDDHAYLQRKGVPAIGLRQTEDGRLIVPVLNPSGKVQSLQFILPDKLAEGTDKPFLKGGKTAGGFFPIPARDKSRDGPLLIAEGYATAASLHLATGRAVLVAFSSGNLKAVAAMARERYPRREIVLCADNDCQTTRPDGTPRNPGIEAATAAAQAVGGKLAICPAHEGRATDFNDLHRWRSLEAVAEVVAAAIERKAESMPDVLPSGFSLRRGGSLPGLWHTEPKEGGDPVETWVGGLLSVLGATRDENGNAWGLLLEWSDDDGNPHTWAMPKAMLAGRDSSAVLARLADEGWRFASGQRARNLFYRFLTEYQTRRRALCVPRTGWHNGVFVFPDAIVQNSAGRAGRAGQAYSCNALQPSSNDAGLLDVLDNERIVLQVQTPHNPFRLAGTLDAWRETVGAWAVGNSRLMLAISASLAAVLLEPGGMESGGFNFTGGSSIGKTTALVVAASVWGKGTPSGGYVQSWRATSNGLEGLAALHSDAALCLDEIGQAPGRTIIEASYMLANGMGKSRACQDGSARAIRSWRCMVLSTGEKGLAEKVAEEGGSVQAGQLVRLIDVPADAGAGMGIFEDLHGHDTPQAFADALKLAASTDYGHAARFFIGKILETPDTAAQLHTAMDAGTSILCPERASGQVQRVARRFLLCAAAGEMAAEWGMVPWEKGAALEAARKCFAAWLELRGDSGEAEDAALLSQVRLFLEQHGASRFQDADNPAATCINRAGFRHKVEDGTEFYVLPESFKAELCKGYNATWAAGVLHRSGLLLRGEGRNMMRYSPVELPGFGRRRCYTLFVGGDAHVAD